MNKLNKISVGIVGGTGYTGIELIRLLLNHPMVEIKSIFSRTEQGKKLSEVFNGFESVDLKFTEKIEQSLSECQVIFYATPHQVAMNEVESLLKLNIKIIDLSADFRLHDKIIFSNWYGEHSSPHLLKEAVYGLPEFARKNIQKTNLVANPGCYPTSIQLPLVPLIKNNLIEAHPIIIDSKSGVSGAGKSLKTTNLFSECAENFKMYGQDGHRHLPEINQSLSEYSGKQCQVVFVPHLVPMTRGIESTIYCQLQKGVQIEHIYESWNANFSKEYFITIKNTPPSTKEVRGTNKCAFSAHLPTDKNTLVISSVIDNLMKGASGQAVQNMNIMMNFPEKMGLEYSPLLA